MKTMILASGSPRRKELISLLPWTFEVVTKEVDETFKATLSVKENVQALALKKARAVAKMHPERIVIGADTMVCLGEEYMGKPENEEAAVSMLQKLSCKKHCVISGVAIVCLSRNIQVTFTEKTYVKMGELTEEEIRQYVQSQEPMDKCGSYAIQGLGAKYIEGIEGDYFNVVGLPIHHLYEEMKKIEDRNA